MIDDVCSNTLGVVPVFVNAGSAILPAILAPLASAVALLFKPKELMRTFRRRPIIPMMLVLIGVGSYYLIAWVVSPPVKAVENPWIAAAASADETSSLVGGSNGATTRSTDPGPQNPDARSNAVVFRYDFTRCGYAGGPSPRNLRTAWSFPAEDAWFVSSPAVVGGRVYAATAGIDPIADTTFGAVVCLDAATRKRIWKTEEAGGERFKAFFSSPAVSADGKSIVIGQGLHNDSDCALLCFDAQTGAVRWRVKTPLHIEGSPAIFGDMAVAGAGAIEGPDHKPTTHIGMVVAVRISDGRELWRYDLNDPESSPAIDSEGTIYIGSGFQGSAVVALRPQTNAELDANGLKREIWRARLPYPMTGPVTLAGDLVIAGGGNGDFVYTDPRPVGLVVALDRKTGEIRWKTDMPNSVLGAVAVRDGKVICPVANGQVIALNLTDGKEVWNQKVNGRSPVLAGPAFTGSTIYAVSRDGYLAVLDAADGKVIQTVYLNSQNKSGSEYSFSSPTIANGCVFVGSETGGLKCLTGEDK